MTYTLIKSYKPILKEYLEQGLRNSFGEMKGLL